MSNKEISNDMCVVFSSERKHAFAEKIAIYLRHEGFEAECLLVDQIFEATFADNSALIFILLDADLIDIFNDIVDSLHSQCIHKNVLLIKFGDIAVAPHNFAHIELKDQENINVQDICKVISFASVACSKSGRLEVDSLSVDLAYANTLDIYSDSIFTAKYIDSWANDPPRLLIEDFLSHITSGRSLILDAGCGPGHHANYMQSMGHTVIGVDLSDSFLDFAKENSSGAKFYKEDMTNTSFTSNSFDAIWSCASAVHLPPNLFNSQVIEFYRLLKHGGVLSITISVGKKGNVSPDGRYFFSYTTEDEPLNILRDQGFNIVKFSHKVLEKTTYNQNTYGSWLTIIAAKI